MNIGVQKSQKRPSPLVDDLLHAIGQPLTSLQMCTLLRDRPSLDGGEFATLIDDMAGQVILLSHLFGTLRQVLHSEVEPTHVAAGDLELLLRKLLPRWQQAALRRSVTVIVTGVPLDRSSHQEPVFCGSLETGLQEILAAALESTPDQGSISVLLSVAPCQLRIIGGPLLSEACFSSRFGLPAAKMLFDSGEQEFSYNLSPFEATLTLLRAALPVADAAAGDQALSGHAGYSG